MDPFAKKMVQGSVAFGAVMLLLFAAMTVLYLHLRPRCSDQVVSSAASLDGRSVATVMEARCGDEAPFLTHVNLRRAGEPISLGYFSGRSEDGEIFLLQQDAESAALTLQWTGPNRLAISCSHCQLAFLKKRQERWGDVDITYFFDTR
jgi:hypothetical protein